MTNLTWQINKIMYFNIRRVKVINYLLTSDYFAITRIKFLNFLNFNPLF